MLSAPSPFDSNPFSSRWVRPGALPFLFPSGVDLPALVAQLERNRWWGEILGPHGTGKSTLLAALLPAIESGGRRTLPFELHDGQRRLPAGWRKAVQSLGAGLVAVDGYEQLGRWSRMRLRRLCRLNACGLLVTAHAPAGFPLLYRTSVNLETALRVVNELLPRPSHLIGAEDVADALEANSGNLREALLTLYHRYETARRQVPSGSASRRTTYGTTGVLGKRGTE